MALPCATGMVHIDLLEDLSLRMKTEEGKRMVWDIVRKKWVPFTPEEHVRQALLHYFVHKANYPPGLIAVERQISYGKLNKRYDIVLYDNALQPWLLAECKAPDMPLTRNTLHQLLQYHSQVPCPYWLLSNGVETFCADAQDIGRIVWLEKIPF